MKTEGKIIWKQEIINDYFPASNLVPYHTLATCVASGGATVACKMAQKTHKDWSDRAGCHLRNVLLKPIGQNLRSKRESEIHEITVQVDSNGALQDDGFLDQDHLESDDYHEEDKREMINENFIIPWSFGNILSQNNDDDDNDVQEDIYVTEYDVYASYAKLFHDDPTDYYMVEEDPYITEYLKNNKNPKIRLVADMMNDHKNDDVIVLPSEGDLEEDEDDIFKYENALWWCSFFYLFLWILLCCFGFFLFDLICAWSFCLWKV